MARAPGHGWWPYLVPYGTFLLLVELQSRAPDVWDPWVRLLRVGATAALLAFFFARGSYPELRGYRPRGRELAGDALLGIAIAALWMGPYLLIPALPRPAPETGFDAGAFGESGRAFALALRLVGFAAVTPFMEELFVRSFLIRLVDALDRDMDFRRVAIGAFTWRSFLVTVLWFTFTHVPWEWAVAPVAGALFNLWLYRRRHLGATIVAHATANASIWLAVVLGPPGWRIFL